MTAMHKTDVKVKCETVNK